MTPPPCTTCFYHATAGRMVDPCFPCGMDRDLFTGQPKQPYDQWVDGKLSATEVAAKRRAEFEEMDRAFRAGLAEDQELRAELESLFGPLDEKLTPIT